MYDSNLEEKIEAIAKDLVNEDKVIKEKAYQEMLELYKIYPTNIIIIDWLAFYNLFEIKNYNEARIYYNLILSMEPNNKLAKEGIQNVNEFGKENLLSETGKGAYLPSEINRNNINLNFLPASVILVLKIIILGTILYFLFPKLIFGWSDMQIDKIDTWKNRPIDAQELTINTPQEFNKLTKDKVYDIRKNFVNTSLFSKDGYEPNSAVFGSIVDGKPWWGINQIACTPDNNKNFDKTKGISAVSKYINNPNMLIGTMFPFNYPLEYDRIGYCNSEYAKTMPFDLFYLKEQNLIVAKYKIDKRILNSYVNWQGRNRKYFLTLTGLNARDLGYKYGYAFIQKNLETTEQSSIGNDIIEFRDYIHLGSSCGHKEGCNNLSPYQNELDYKITKLPAQMTIKLWKNKPINKFIKADIYYRIMFEKL